MALLWALLLLTCTTGISFAHAHSSSTSDSHSTAEAVVSAWRVRSPRVPHNDMTAQTPCMRYSHSAVIHGSYMYMSHGYMYDHKLHRATWLGDTWRFHLKSNTWECVYRPALDASSLHVAHPTDAPCPRNGAGAVSYSHFMYLHGGDDGGHSLGASSYQYNIMGDMWRFDTRARVWERLDAPPSAAPPALQGSVAWHPAVHHSAVVLEHSLVTFGGLTKAEGDADVSISGEVWEYSFSANRWSLLLPRSSPSTGPVRRYGHTAVVTKHGDGDGHVMYVFGGYTERSTNLNDLWQLHVTTHGDGATREQREVHWSLVASAPLRDGDTTAVPEAPHVPSPRGYHVMAAVNTHLYMFGGARCDPGCTCHNDFWSYDTHTREWTQHEAESGAAESRPVHRYKHSMVFDGQHVSGCAALVVFGGESYRPSGYYNDVWSRCLTDLEEHDATARSREEVQEEDARAQLHVVQGHHLSVTAVMFVVGSLVTVLCVLVWTSRQKQHLQDIEQAHGPGTGTSPSGSPEFVYQYQYRQQPPVERRGAKGRVT